MDYRSYKFVFGQGPTRISNFLGVTPEIDIGVYTLAPIIKRPARALINEKKSYGNSRIDRRNVPHKQEKPFRYVRYTPNSSCLYMYIKSTVKEGVLALTDYNMKDPFVPKSTGDRLVFVRSFGKYRN